MFLNQSINI